MQKKYTKKALGGLAFIFSAALIFAAVLWVQAQIAPGTVTTPTFTPPTDVDIPGCSWTISNIKDAAHDNVPWISTDEAVNNQAASICKCTNDPNPNTAILDITPLDSTNSGGYLEMNTQWPYFQNFWTCDNDAFFNPGCNTGVSDYFVYLACG
jgi:hypothetical protein